MAKEKGWKAEMEAEEKDKDLIKTKTEFLRLLKELRPQMKCELNFV